MMHLSGVLICNFKWSSLGKSASSLGLSVYVCICSYTLTPDTNTRALLAYNQWLILFYESTSGGFLQRWFIFPCSLFKPQSGSTIMLFCLIKMCLWVKCKNSSRAAVHKIPWNRSSPADLNIWPLHNLLFTPLDAAKCCSNYNGANGHFSS